MPDLKDILNTNDDINQEDLIKYLHGNASDKERFAIENQMADSSFMNDAVEGLQHFKNPEEAKKYEIQLNQQLQKYTENRQVRKKEEA